jgi:hypothetical protein
MNGYKTSNLFFIVLAIWFCDTIIIWNNDTEWMTSSTVWITRYIKINTHLVNGSWHKHLSVNVTQTDCVLWEETLKQEVTCEWPLTSMWVTFDLVTIKSTVKTKSNIFFFFFFKWLTFYCYWHVDSPAHS